MEKQCMIAVQHAYRQGLPMRIAAGTALTILSLLPPPRSRWRRTTIRAGQAGN